MSPDTLNFFKRPKIIILNHHQTTLFLFGKIIPVMTGGFKKLSLGYATKATFLRLTIRDMWRRQITLSDVLRKLVVEK